MIKDWNLREKYKRKRDNVNEWKNEISFIKKSEKERRKMNEINEKRIPMESEKEARRTNGKAHQTILIKLKVKETNE